MTIQNDSVNQKKKNYNKTQKGIYMTYLCTARWMYTWYTRQPMQDVEIFCSTKRKRKQIKNIPSNTGTIF